MLWIYKPEGLLSTKCSIWVLNFVWFKKKETVYLGISELKSSQGSSHGAQPSKSYYRGSAFQTEGTLQWWMTLYTYKQYLKCLKLYEKSVRLKEKNSKMLLETQLPLNIYFLIYERDFLFGDMLDVLCSTSLTRNQSYKNFFASISTYNNHLILFVIVKIWSNINLFQ